MVGGAARFVRTGEWGKFGKVLNACGLWGWDFWVGEGSGWVAVRAGGWG